MQIMALYKQVTNMFRVFVKHFLAGLPPHSTIKTGTPITLTTYGAVAMLITSDL